MDAGKKRMPASIWTRCHGRIAPWKDRSIWMPGSHKNGGQCEKWDFSHAGMESHMSKNNTTVIKTKKNLSFAERLKRAKNKGDIAAGLMLLPAVIMLLVVSVYPFCWIFRYVCYEYNGLTATYTGMHNFERMLTDTTFWQSVLHTFEYAVLKIIFIIPLALIMAVFLNQKLRGSSFFRGVYFMPTIISTAVSSMVFGFIFAAYNGVLNGVLKAIGVIGQNVNWLGDAKTAMWSVLIVALWAGFGNYMIYFISGMSSISEDV